MKSALLVSLVLATVSAPASLAFARSNDAQMLLLDPTARTEQRCNARGMGVVGREHRPLHPDELVAYAYANTVIKQNTIHAPGAAIRSGSTWFHLSYACETSDDGLNIKSFTYSLGDAIPEGEWSKHYLVPP